MSKSRKEIVVHFLKRSKHKIVAEETGINVQIIGKISRGDIQNPGTDSIQTLYDYIIEQYNIIKEQNLES